MCSSESQCFRRHTSPLEQPGNGDAGGMNVYVLELAKQLAKREIEVEVFTRATSSHQPPIVEAFDGVRVHHVSAGPFEGLQKNDLPAQLCSFVRVVLRAEVEREPGYFHLVHSHYWLSGQVGTVARERWHVPLVHSMHTMAKVKNALLAEGDTPEPIRRILGEDEIVRLADRLIANTGEENTTWSPCTAPSPRRWPSSVRASILPFSVRVGKPRREHGWGYRPPRTRVARRTGRGDCRSGFGYGARAPQCTGRSCQATGCR